jgi:hypothetical protein
MFAPDSSVVFYFYGRERTQGTPSFTKRNWRGAFDCGNPPPITPCSLCKKISLAPLTLAGGLYRKRNEPGKIPRGNQEVGASLMLRERVSA